MNSKAPFRRIAGQAAAHRTGAAWRAMLLVLSLPLLVWLAADGAGAFSDDGDRPPAEAAENRRGDAGRDGNREGGPPAARERRGERELRDREHGHGERDDRERGPRDADRGGRNSVRPEGRFGQGRFSEPREGVADSGRDRDHRGFDQSRPPHPEEMMRILRELQEDVRQLRREVQLLRQPRFAGPPHDHPGSGLPPREGDRPRFGERPRDGERGPREGERPGFGERPRDGERGPREGERPGLGERPRDGERGPREGERPVPAERPDEPEA